MAQPVNVPYSSFRKRAARIRRMPSTGRYRREDLDAYAESLRPKRKRLPGTEIGLTAAGGYYTTAFPFCGTNMPRRCEFYTFLGDGPAAQSVGYSSKSLSGKLAQSQVPCVGNVRLRF